MTQSEPTARHWRIFNRWLLALGLGIPGLLYLAVLLIDPFDNLPLSPDLARYQVGGSDRFFKPSVARRAHYDGAIIGTSTAMLLHPRRLGRALGLDLANLAMPAASPFEQVRLLRLFHAHHPEPALVMVALDHVWCSRRALPRLIGANAGGTLPDWLYDDNPWNDWPDFSPDVLKFARRQLRAILDPAQDPAGRDGYYDFTVRDYGAYDLEQARRNIYGDAAPRPRPESRTPLAVDPAERKRWLFEDIAMLRKALVELPDVTAKLLVFMPLHWYAQPAPGSRAEAELHECKRRVTGFAGDLRNLSVVDFMRHTPITLRDVNYWDGVHVTHAVIRRLEQVMTAVLRGGDAPGPDHVLLFPAEDGR